MQRPDAHIQPQPVVDIAIDLFVVVSVARVGLAKSPTEPLKQRPKGEISLRAHVENAGQLREILELPSFFGPAHPDRTDAY